MSPAQYEQSKRQIGAIGVAALLSISMCVFVSWWYWPIPAMLGALSLVLWYNAYSSMKMAIHFSRGNICYRCGAGMTNGPGVACARCGHVASDAERARIEEIGTRQIWF